MPTSSPTDLSVSLPWPPCFCSLPQTMPNVIILDEPELGLHPYAISQLAEMIKDASIHAQVIIATQSKDLVDHFDIGDISVVEMNKETQATSVTHLDAKEYHLWLQLYGERTLGQKHHRRTSRTKAKIIHVLCEGQTEQGFVEEVLRPYLQAQGVAGVKSIPSPLTRKRMPVVEC